MPTNDGRSPIKVHTHKRTQVHGVRSSLVVTHPSRDATSPCMFVSSRVKSFKLILFSPSLAGFEPESKCLWLECECESQGSSGHFSTVVQNFCLYVLKGPSTHQEGQFVPTAGGWNRFGRYILANETMHIHNTIARLCILASSDRVSAFFHSLKMKTHDVFLRITY